MPALSVVIPVYQSEPYLEACVSSVLAQDFSDFEVILVDDGSTDRSGALCDAFAAADGRVRVLHVANGGMAAARNRGMAAATGEFLAFADSDDVLDPGAFSCMAARAAETGADVVLCGYYLDAPGAGLRVVSMSDAVLEPGEYGAALAELKAKNLIDPPWNKLYRRSFLTAHGLEMPVGEPFEDTDFNLRLLLCAPRLALCERAFYHYMQRLRGNVTRRYHADKLQMLLRRADLLDAVAARFPAPGLPEYCAFYRVKSVFSALVDEYLPASGRRGAARRAAIRAALAEPSVQRACETARATSFQDKLTLFAARTRLPGFAPAYCRCVYLLKYKLKNLFFRVKS